MPEITDDAMRYLASLPYPGNIRELKNLVERTLLVGSDGEFTSQHFKAQYHEPAIPQSASRNTGLEGMTLEQMEKTAIIEAIRRHKGNLSRVALSLGITRQSLYRRMEKFGINA